MDYSRELFLERPLPASPEAERIILGAIIIDNVLIAQAAESLSPDDFYSPLHRRVFSAMLKLFERGANIEPVLIGEELKKEGQLESIGGVATITNLTYGLPHFSTIETYIKTVQDKKLVRDLIKTCSEITSVALAEEESTDELTNFAEGKIFDVCNRPTATKPELIAPLAFASVQQKKDIHSGKIKVAGLSTGFSDLDKMLGGLMPSDLIIIAARPSMGKTTLVMNIAQNAALLENAVVAVFSLEMSKELLTDRVICSEAKIDATRYRNGFMTNDEFTRAYIAAERLQSAKLIIDDTPGIAPVEMLAKCRRIYAEHKRLDLIVVDYLQLMSSSKRSENRQQEVSQISRELKAIAKMLGVPLIALSQLSRAPEARNPPRPLMSDLRESGEIEQTADVVAFIYRDEYYKPTDENAGVAEILISKQRNGPTGVVKMAFLREFTSFQDAYFEGDSQRPDYRSRAAADDSDEDERFK